MSGELPVGWAAATLGQVVGRPRAKAAPSAHPELPFVGMDSIAPGGMNLLSVGRFGDMKSAGGVFEPGDVLYGRMRPYLNKVHLAKQRGACSAEFVVMPPTPSICGDYLAYLIHQRAFVNFASEQSSGDRPRVDFEGLASFDFGLPPKDEQKRIVSRIEELFSEIDEGERALERVGQLVERYRQAVLKAAVTGELTREWRAAHANDSHVTVSSGIATDTLGALPSGWRKLRVDETGEVQLGRQRSPDHHQGEHMRQYLRVANVFEERIDTSDVMSMNFTPDEYERFQLRVGDIFLNEGQSKDLVGRPAMYRGELPGGCFTNSLVRFRCRAELLPEFAMCVFLHFLKSGHFQKIAKITTNIAHLGAGRFAEMAFPLPPLDEQRVIVDRVATQASVWRALLDDVSVRRRHASSLRQSILKAAFSGQLVPQDPNDEPASALLARVAAQAPVAAKGRRRRLSQSNPAETK